VNRMDKTLGLALSEVINDEWEKCRRFVEDLKRYAPALEIQRWHEEQQKFADLFRPSADVARLQEMMNEIHRPFAELQRSWKAMDQLFRPSEELAKASELSKALETMDRLPKAVVELPKWFEQEQKGAMHDVLGECAQGARGLRFRGAAI
jgi:hypothetical protein